METDPGHRCLKEWVKVRYVIVTNDTDCSNITLVPQRMGRESLYTETENEDEVTVEQKRRMKRKPPFSQGTRKRSPSNKQTWRKCPGNRTKSLHLPEEREGVTKSSKGNIVSSQS